MRVTNSRLWALALHGLKDLLGQVNNIDIHRKLRLQLNAWAACVVVAQSQSLPLLLS